MKKLFSILTISILFFSCHYETVEIRRPSDQRIICCEKGPSLYGTVMLKLVDSQGNWSNTVDFNKLDLIRKDNHWNNIPKEPGESLIKIVKKSTDTTSVDGIKITFATNWASFNKNFYFFKLKRNENTEDKIICIYKDFKHDNDWGKILTVIIYNGKEYIVNNRNLDDVDHDKDLVVTPIDIVVE